MPINNLCETIITVLYEYISIQVYCSIFCYLDAIAFEFLLLNQNNQKEINGHVVRSAFDQWSAIKTDSHGQTTGDQGLSKDDFSVRKKVCIFL